MNTLRTRIVVFALLSLLPIQATSGQLIRIFNNGAGGVDIRVPFVRVQTDPYGGTWVRAPFVQVQSPPPWYRGQPVYPPPMYAQPLVPQPAETPSVLNGNAAPARIPGQGNSAEIPPSAMAGGRPTLQPSLDTVPVPAAAIQQSTALQPAESGELKSVLDMEGDPNRLASLRRQLIASAAELDRALLTYTNAATWQEYLRLPDFVVNETGWLESAVLDPQQQEQLEATLKRYARTARDPDLKLINSFESFGQTHRELDALVNRLAKSQGAQSAELPKPAGYPDR